MAKNKNKRFINFFLTMMIFHLLEISFHKMFNKYASGMLYSDL